MGIESSGANITALIAIGMAVAFVAIDRSSATSRMLSLCLVGLGLAILVDVNLILATPVAQLSAYSGLAALPSVLALTAGAEWVLRVRRTIPTHGLRTRPVDVGLRVAQGLAILYGVLSLILPQARALYFLRAFSSTADVLATPAFYLLAVPFYLSLLLMAQATLMTLNRKPDLAESLRLIGLAVSAPFIAAGSLLPDQWAPYSVALGEMVLLTGALNYHVLQGRRGAFMSRFMAPQVAALVREEGLQRAIDNRSLELSVVACDLRGFTGHAEVLSSDAVIRALDDYYHVVGEVAARYGATIKDYAGDGVLMLVGAPLPYDDHADRAVALATAILAAVAPLLADWQRYGHTLGLGVGVASGIATVGVVGETRLEYAAVGSVVNRAARLCAAAAAGEALCDERTRELLTPHHRQWLTDERRLDLKGIGEAVPAWLLAALVAS